MERELSTKQLIGDATGQLSLNIVTSLMTLMTFYYTEIVGVSAGLVGTILLMTKMFDAVADIGMGVLVDRTRSKHGQARPWLLWMVIPMFLSVLLLFAVPDLSSGAQITYAVATNILFYVFVFTPTSIPYQSLMALTTRSTQDRTLMGVFRASFGFFSGALVTIGFIPIVNSIGGGQHEWFLLAACFGLIASIGIYITFRFTKEKYNTEQLKLLGEVKQTFSLGTGIKLLFTNRYWLIIFFVGLLASVMFSLSGSSGMYYAKYIWGDVNLIGIMGGLTLIPTLIIFLVSGPIIKRWGQRNTAVVGLVIGILGCLFRAFDPDNIPLGLVGSVLQAFGMIPMLVVLGPLMTNTIEYGEWKHGQRIVGLTNSVNSFGGKVGTAIGTALIGWLLAFGHFQEGAATQTESATFMIIVLSVYLPLILYACIAFLLCFYSLEKQYIGILDDLQKRRGDRID